MTGWKPVRRPAIPVETALVMGGRAGRGVRLPEFRGGRLGGEDVAEGALQVGEPETVADLFSPPGQDLLAGGDHARDLAEHDLEYRVRRSDRDEQPPGGVGFPEDAREGLREVC